MENYNEEFLKESIKESLIKESINNFAREKPLTEEDENNIRQFLSNSSLIDDKATKIINDLNKHFIWKNFITSDKTSKIVFGVGNFIIAGLLAYAVNEESSLLIVISVLLFLVLHIYNILVDNDSNKE